MVPDDAIQKLVARSEPADDGSGCIRWQGAHTPKGYGQFSVNGKVRSVHVIAHLAWVGEIPDGYEIDHVAARGCRWRDCINPEHLEAVTHAENLARARTTPTHCTRGHELTPENSKPTPARYGRRGRKCRRCFNDKRNAKRRACRLGAGAGAHV